MQISIEFDHIMKNQTITLLDLSLDILGLNSPYSIMWTSYFDSKTLKIMFNSSPTLLGGVGEKIRLQLLNVLAFKSSEGLSISEPKQFDFIVNKISTSDTIKSASSGVSYTFIFGMLISIGISLFTGGSIELMWSLANALQILFFYG